MEVPELLRVESHRWSDGLRTSWQEILPGGTSVRHVDEWFDASGILMRHLEKCPHCMRVEDGDHALVGAVWTETCMQANIVEPANWSAPAQPWRSTRTHAKCSR